MNLTHPESLTFGKRYKQAQRLLKETSRANNPNWYADALAINLQLHIFVGSDSGAISYIRNIETGAWAKGPNISPEMEEDPSLLKPTIDGIVSEYLQDSKHPAIGVVLYVADEFATAELGPEHQNPAEITDLRERINQDPRSILEDQSISNESHSWRLFPYPGAASGDKFATAIAFTRRHEPLLEEFRSYGNENNIPINTRALSAPLCAISALPWLLEQKPENGFAAIYHYPRFSVIGFFNVHGDLVLIRTLQHHGGSPFSPQTASAIMATTATLELANPHVFIVPMAGFAPNGMSDSIGSMMPNSQVITLSPTSSALHIPTAPSAASNQSDLGVTRPWKWSDLTAQTAVESEPSQADAPDNDSTIPGVTRPWKLQDMAAVAMLSQVRLEVVATTNPPSASKSLLAESHTFKTLVEEMWPLQDFLPKSPEESALYPDHTEIRILKWSKLIKIGAAAATLLFGAKASLDIFTASQDPAWNYQPQNPNFKIAKLSKDLHEYNQLDSLLSNRSNTWSSMELIPKLFAENRQILVDKFQYDVAIRTENKANNKVPLTRVWKLSGKAARKEREFLDSLNATDNIASIFKQVHESTQDQSFDLSLASRTPTAKSTTRLGSRRSSRRGESADYPVNFSITITQQLTTEDPLSLPAK